jgi:phosphatidylserine/phosphatidylglycerophosphate/cardiolipin synthase-like enzyme
MFTAPLDPAGWTLTTPGWLTVPSGLRYGDVRLLQMRAERPAADGVVSAPAPGTLRPMAASGAPTWVELQVNPFPMRRTAQALPFGLPTFYLVFDPGATVTPFADGDAVVAGDQLATVAALTLLCAGQDRVARDPALWAGQILAALPAADRPAWEAFADAVAAQTATGAAPVLILDHRGSPRDTATIEIRSGATTATAELTAADGGDLQRAVARMHAADPATMPLTAVLPAGGGAATLRPAGADVQLARLEDGAHAAAQIEVTPAFRHVTLTDLPDWFALQFAQSDHPLARYTRNNEYRPFVNGGEYYDDLFRRLQDAASAGADSGLHLVGGWQTFPAEPLTDVRPWDPAPDPGQPPLPKSLVEAATLIGGAGGATRFLSPKFIQLDPGSPVETFELTLFSAIVMGLLRGQNVDFIRTDAAGAIILLALFILNGIALTWIIDTDGSALEPNKDAVELLEPIQNAASSYAPHPATVEDNPASPPLSGFPYDSFFKLIRHFGFYHTKFAVVKAGAERYGYAGGIDINPNRLDDVRHLGRGPYHDVHARVRGKAVRDVELTFAERWSRDGGTTGLAFDAAAAGELADAGTDVVQVARTYFKAADSSRELDFAPTGDRTIHDTLIQAISAAKEFIYIEDQYYTPPDDYCEALLAKVTSRDIKTLVIVLPSTPDQPFGEIERTGFIAQLHTADAGAGIVRIGYPRRHYTVADNELRASSGRLELYEDLQASGGVDPTVVLGPKQRLPPVPFWLSVEGELMYVFNESTTPSPDPEHAQVFEVVRGDDTRAGVRPRPHKQGAPATVIDLAGIYVHAKMMIVDDAFVSIGSANINRRGLFHDGEINLFSVPQQLKATPANPVAALRRRLWAEMLDLPLATAGPLLADPRAAARLFDRSALEGNRFVDFDAHPTHLMYDATGGDGIALIVFRAALLDEFVIPDHKKMFDAVVDPTSAVEDA